MVIESVLLVEAVIKFGSLQLVFAIILSIAATFTLNILKPKYMEIAEDAANRHLVREHISRMATTRFCINFFSPIAFVMLLGGAVLWSEIPEFVEQRAHPSFEHLLPNARLVVELLNTNGRRVQAAPEEPTIFATSVNKDIRTPKYVIRGVSLTDLIQEIVGNPEKIITQAAWIIVGFLGLFIYAFFMTDRISSATKFSQAKGP